MSSKTQNVGHFVEYRLKRIVNSSSDGAVKASLANLRRGIGTTPEDIPELWELFLQDLPEEMLSRSGVPIPCTMDCLYCTERCLRFINRAKICRRNLCIGKETAWGRQ